MKFLYSRDKIQIIKSYLDGEPWFAKCKSLHVTDNSGTAVSVGAAASAARYLENDQRVNNYVKIYNQLSTFTYIANKNIIITLHDCNWVLRTVPTVVTVDHIRRTYVPTEIYLKHKILPNFIYEIKTSI